MNCVARHDAALGSVSMQCSLHPPMSCLHPPCRIGLCTVDGEGHFLGEGTHRINNGRFSFKGFESAFQEHITVGTKHRCLVPAGCLGKAIQNGQQVLIEPGEPRYYADPTFVYAGSILTNAAVIRHGPIR